MGIISAGISALSGGISAIGAAISSICSKLGSSAIMSTGRVMIDAIKAGMPYVGKICDVAMTVSKAFGLFSSGQNESDMCELGMRTEQAVEQGITSDKFDSYQAYIDYLREEIILTKENIEKLDNLSDIDKLKYVGIGCAMTFAFIDEKYEIEIPASFWPTGINLGIESQQIKPLLDIFELAQLKPDLEGFKKGYLSSDLHREIYDLVSNKLYGVLSQETIDKILS